jgi:hypothetical protein
LNVPKAGTTSTGRPESMTIRSAKSMSMPLSLSGLTWLTTTRSAWRACSMTVAAISGERESTKRHSAASPFACMWPSN